MKEREHRSVARDSSTAVHDGSAPGRRSRTAALREATPTTSAIVDASAASRAIEQPDPGVPVDPALAGRVGAVVGVDVTHARVHQDPAARVASAALGARAFAHGAHVFLGEGESADDVALMSHELAHVAQQRTFAAPRPQSKLEVGPADGPAEVHADAVADAVVAGRQGTRVLVDDGPVATGQMLKSSFLETLREQVTAIADTQLAAAGMTALGCPYIERYFARYSSQPAVAAEALLHRFAPRTRNARTAAELYEPTLDRVREGVRAWVQTGQLPADVAEVEPSLAHGSDAIAPPAGEAGQARPTVARALRPAGKETLASLEAELGPGQPLGGPVADLARASLDVDVAQVQVHRGDVAARKAADADATAFTVGSHVVMGADAPSADTPDEQALLAHELAHVAQQQRAAAAPGQRLRPVGEEATGAETEADHGAVGLLATLWGGATSLARKLLDGGRPTVTGVQLQRCKRGPEMPPGPPLEPKQVDRMLAADATIFDDIEDDVLAGITGENRVKMYDDIEAFAYVLATKAPNVSTIWREDATPEQLMKERMAAARKAAEETRGWVDRNARIAHIYTRGTPGFVTIHEMIHLYTHPSVFEELGPMFPEGLAEFWTRHLCAKNDIPYATVSQYEAPLAVVDALAEEIGLELLSALTFNGATLPAQQIIDAKGPGTWDQFVAAVTARQWGRARTLIRNAGGAAFVRDQVERFRDAYEERVPGAAAGDEAPPR